MMSDDSSAEPTEAPEGEAGGPAGGEIDVQQLADKVYRLMVADIRLGRARGESVGGRRR